MISKFLKALANIGGEGTRATVFSIEDFVKGLLPGSESEKVAEFLRKDFKSKEVLLPAGETMDQLGAFQIRTKDADKDNKLQIIQKDTVKGILGRSPDYSDALAMRMYYEIDGNFGKYFVQ